MTITPATWTIITGTLLPLVVAAITHSGASRRFKGQTGVIVAAIGALVVRFTQVDGSAFLSWGAVADIGLVYVPQLLAYYGFWKKLGINARIFPDRGLG